MKLVPIVFTFDQSLELAAGVCITSLLENAENDTFYDIFILHGPHNNFSTSLLCEISKKYSNCKLTFREVEREFVGAYKIRGIPETAYYRLISPELIPEYEQFIYSDVDVIFREDLWKYFSIDLEDNYFGAVDTCSVLRPDYQKYLAKEYGYNYRDGYYYSGNLVINSKQLLLDGKLQDFRELGRNAYHQQDMTIINLSCKGKITPMSPAYCLTISLYSLMVNRRKDMEDIYGIEEIDHALKSGIVHYNGAKPWNEVCLNMDIWWDYYRKSIFFDEKFAYDFWYNQTYRIEKMSLWKRVKQVARYFREGGRK